MRNFLLVILVSLICFSHAEGRTEQDYNFLVWWELKDAGRYINKNEYLPKPVEELRKQRRLLRSSLEEPKHLFIRWGAFPFFQKDRAPEMILNNTRTWMKAPDGSIAKVDFSQEGGECYLDVPHNTDLNGIYLIAGRIDAGERDIDGDGSKERIYFYPKSIIGHWKGYGTTESEQHLDINAPDISLEIVPLRPSRYIGCIQISHRDYDLQVLYCGQPLADAEVLVLTERGWRKTFKTDSRGRFTIKPVESQGAPRNWETYLYVIGYHDPSKAEFHIASLPMLVDPPWPLWRSWEAVLIFWTIAGVGFVVIIVIVVLYRKNQRKERMMVTFNNHRISGEQG